MPLPLEPLLRAAGTSLRAFRDTTGSRTSTLQRAKRDGINVATADRWAIRIDRHPIEVYGIDAWIEALREETNA